MECETDRQTDRGINGLGWRWLPGCLAHEEQGELFDPH